MDTNQGELTFKYVRSSEYRVVAVNGAHGGITGRGDFRIDLFLESGAIPTTITHSLTPDGLGPEIGRDPPPPDIVRELQVAVVLQLDQAKSLAHWILENLRQFEALKGQATK
jgi:hypothetical protein